MSVASSGRERVQAQAELVIQIKGKRKLSLHVPSEIMSDKKALADAAAADDRVQALLGSNVVSKIIAIPGDPKKKRAPLVNFVI